MPLNAKLVVVGGDVKTTEIPLKLPSIIGRGRGIAIILPHPLVSRQHCEVYESAGQLMVRDLGSLNGTFVNNERITESILGPGELLTVGTVTFRAVYELEGGKKPAVATVKEKPGDKTVRVAKATTRAAPKSSEPKKATQDSSGPLEFDFGATPAATQEVVAGSQPGGPTHVTERLQPEKAESSPTKAAAAQVKKKPAAAPPPDESSSDADMNEQSSASSDDDLNDFLDSLKDK
jgi:predicted component of type VI protein secretion system